MLTTRRQNQLDRIWDALSDVIEESDAVIPEYLRQKCKRAYVDIRRLTLELQAEERGSVADYGSPVLRGAGRD